LRAGADSAAKAGLTDATGNRSYAPTHPARLSLVQPPVKADTTTPWREKSHRARDREAGSLAGWVRIPGQHQVTPPMSEATAMARRDDRSAEAQAYRRLYKTARWQALRMRVLVRDLMTCQVCGKLEGNSAQLVANHIEPHKGDEALFWSEANLAATCKTCHDSAIQRDEKRAEAGKLPIQPCGTDGWPLV